MAVAIDKYVCPFCGQKTLFVGAHDDEGNYKGRPGCEYESDPWSGLYYAIHHDGWGNCILCTDAHDLPLGGCFFDTAKETLEAIPTLTPPNEWVSVEERLPENHAQVLMWSAKWNIEEAGSYCNGRFWVYSEIGDAYIADDITHWMLLPAPPDSRPPEVEV